jgi:hypothetical protein
MLVLSGWLFTDPSRSPWAIHRSVVGRLLRRLGAGGGRYLTISEVFPLELRGMAGRSSTPWRPWPAASSPRPCSPT